MNENTLTLDDSWVGAEGEHNGYPFLLRYRPNLQNFAESGLYNQKLEILWSYNQTNEAFMPEADEMNLMEQVENALVELLEQELQAVLAFVYTGEGRREWYWYMQDVEQSAEILNEALADFEQLPLELTVQDDPDWIEYREVVASGEADGVEDEEE